MLPSTKSILIVEDSAPVTLRLLQFLSGINDLIILDSVQDGNSALLKIMQESPDILLLDIQLPGLNGIDVLDLIKELKNPPYIIVLTNNSDDYFKDKCLSLGAHEFYDKTKHFELAIEAVRKRANS